MKTAYPNTNEPVSITLYCNVPFDNTYKHHTIISNLFTYDGEPIYSNSSSSPCERFLDRRVIRPLPKYVYRRWTLNGTFNFDYSNGLLSSIVLELTSEQTLANYMKVECDGEYYYYFITGIKQSNFNTYTLSLELDVLMTYQDELLQGLKDVPVMTKRKHSHRYTDDGLMPCGADLKTGDSAYGGVKPTLLKQLHELHFKNNNMKQIEGVMWLYVCCDNVNFGDTQSGKKVEMNKTIYKNKSKPYPLSMLCVPINVDKFTILKDGEQSSEITRDKETIMTGIYNLIGDGSVHGAKISPYPPFNDSDNSITITYSGSPKTLTLNCHNVNDLYIRTGTAGEYIYEIETGHNKIIYGIGPNSTSVKGSDLVELYGFLLIEEQDDNNYLFDNISNFDFEIANIIAPSITSNRYKDVKLLFSPFRKYVLSAQYSSEGCELFPELLLSENAVSINSQNFKFETISTGYIGDNNFYTRILSNANTYDYYNYAKIGLSGSVNYVFPCGTNALDVFNATQAQSFYTSKIATGLTSGFTIAGGVGSVALGIAGLAGAFGTGGISAIAGAGLIAGGASAIASGVSSEVVMAKSITDKKEELKNTPNSINISGSNFITDDNIVNDMNGLPYVLVYECAKVIQENADDFFYNYGYEVGRECYFNTELLFQNVPNINPTDNNLFGRTIFNYIQLNEDITNKINAEIPQVVKQKLSNIFLNGITIWNFFGFNGMWNNNTPLQVDNWFLKCKLDNTEYKE